MKPLLIPNLIARPQLASLAEHMHQVFARRTTMVVKRNHGSDGVFGDPVVETFLRPIQSIIEPLIGRQLLPTYAYYRHYQYGEDLVSHTDRVACEYGVSIVVDRASSEVWPLFVEVDGNPEPYDGAPGTGVIYTGASRHWRTPCPMDFALQMFLHYVDAKGHHTDWQFNKRPRLTCDKD